MTPHDVGQESIPFMSAVVADVVAEQATTDADSDRIGFQDSTSEDEAFAKIDRRAGSNWGKRN